MDSRTVAVARWVRRYLPCELLAGVASLAAFLLVVAVSGSLVAAAFAAVIGDAAGFYGMAAWRDLRLRLGVTGLAGQRIAWVRAAVDTVRALAVEFGPAEVLGSVVVRPALLVVLPTITGDAVVGWVLGTIAANTVFYAVTIVGFEASRRLARTRVVVG